ncbi:hypothetical protein ACFZAT_15375 [Streptomyces sp. NPDC008163]
MAYEDVYAAADLLLREIGYVQVRTADLARRLRPDEVEDGRARH